MTAYGARSGDLPFTRLRVQSDVFDPEQRTPSVFTNLVTMELWPQPAPRTYLECPQCHLPNAFVTRARVETRTCFCPNCRYLWDSIIPPVQE